LSGFDLDLDQFQSPEINFIRPIRSKIDTKNKAKKRNDEINMFVYRKFQSLMTSEPSSSKEFSDKYFG